MDSSKVYYISAFTPKEQATLRELFGRDLFGKAYSSKKDLKEEQVQRILSQIKPSMRKWFKTSVVLPLFKERQALMESEIEHLEATTLAREEQSVRLMDYLMNKGSYGIAMLYCCLVDTSKDVPAHHQLAGELKNIVQTECGSASEEETVLLNGVDHVDSQHNFDSSMRSLVRVPITAHTAMTFLKNLGLNPFTHLVNCNSLGEICLFSLKRRANSCVEDLVEPMVVTEGLGRYVTVLNTTHPETPGVKAFFLSLGDDWQSLALYLGYSTDELGVYTFKHPANAEKQIMDFLGTWMIPDIGGATLPLMHKLRQLSGVPDVARKPLERSDKATHEHRSRHLKTDYVGKPLRSLDSCKRQGSSDSSSSSSLTSGYSSYRDSPRSTQEHEYSRMSSDGSINGLSSSPDTGRRSQCGHSHPLETHTHSAPYHSTPRPSMGNGTLHGLHNSGDPPMESLYNEHNPNPATHRELQSASTVNDVHTDGSSVRHTIPTDRQITAEDYVMSELYEQGGYCGEEGPGYYGDGESAYHGPRVILFLNMRARGQEESGQSSIESSHDIRDQDPVIEEVIDDDEEDPLSVLSHKPPALTAPPVTASAKNQLSHNTRKSATQEFGVDFSNSTSAPNGLQNPYVLTEPERQALKTVPPGQHDVSQSRDYTVHKPPQDTTPELRIAVEAAESACTADSPLKLESHISHPNNLSTAIEAHGDSPDDLRPDFQELATVGVEAEPIGETIKSVVQDDQQTCAEDVVLAIEDPDGIEVLIALLESGAKVSLPTQAGVYPIHIATAEKQHDKLLLLLNHDVEINAQQPDGKTALHIACIEGDMQSIQILLEKGAKAGIRDNQGYTCLHHRKALESAPIVQYLVHNGAPTDVPSHGTYFTPLLVSSFIGDATAESAYLLVQNGASVNGCDQADSKPLVTACTMGAEHVSDILLENGADANITDQHGTTPLLAAILNKHIELAKKLCGRRSLDGVSAAVDINLPNKAGITPLMAAVNVDNIGLIKDLLKRGANVNTSRVVQKMSLGVYGERDVELTALSDATLKGNVEIVQLLIDYRAEINSTNQRMVPPICFAIRENFVNIVDLLLKQNDMDRSIQGMSWPFIVAVDSKNTHCAQLLLDRYVTGIDAFVEDATHHNLQALVAHVRTYQQLIDPQSRDTTPSAQAMAPPLQQDPPQATEDRCDKDNTSERLSDHSPQHSRSTSCSEESEITSMQSGVASKLFGVLLDEVNRPAVSIGAAAISPDDSTDSSIQNASTPVVSPAKQPAEQAVTQLDSDTSMDIHVASPPPTPKTSTQHPVPVPQTVNDIVVPKASIPLQYASYSPNDLGAVDGGAQGVPAASSASTSNLILNTFTSEDPTTSVAGASQQASSSAPRSVHLTERESDFSVMEHSRRSSSDDSSEILHGGTATSPGVVSPPPELSVVLDTHGGAEILNEFAQICILAVCNSIGQERLVEVATSAGLEHISIFFLQYFYEATTFCQRGALLHGFFGGSPSPLQFMILHSLITKECLFTTLEEMGKQDFPEHLRLALHQFQGSEKVPPTGGSLINGLFNLTFTIGSRGNPSDLEGLLRHSSLSPAQLHTLLPALQQARAQAQVQAQRDTGYRLGDSSEKPTQTSPPVTASEPRLHVNTTPADKPALQPHPVPPSSPVLPHQPPPLTNRQTIPLATPSPSSQTSPLPDHTSYIPPSTKTPIAVARQTQSAASRSESAAPIKTPQPRASLPFEQASLAVDKVMKSPTFVQTVKSEKLPHLQENLPIQQTSPMKPTKKDVAVSEPVQSTLASTAPPPQSRPSPRKCPPDRQGLTHKSRLLVEDEARQERVREATLQAPPPDVTLTPLPTTAKQLMSPSLSSSQSSLGEDFSVTSTRSPESDVRRLTTQGTSVPGQISPLHDVPAAVPTCMVPSIPVEVQTIACTRPPSSINTSSAIKDSADGSPSVPWNPARDSWMGRSTLALSPRNQHNAHPGHLLSLSGQPPAVTQAVVRPPKPLSHEKLPNEKNTKREYDPQQLWSSPDSTKKHIDLLSEHQVPLKHVLQIDDQHDKMETTKHLVSFSTSKSNTVGSDVAMDELKRTEKVEGPSGVNLSASTKPTLQGKSSHFQNLSDAVSRKPTTAPAGAHAQESSSGQDSSPPSRSSSPLPVIDSAKPNIVAQSKKVKKQHQRAGIDETKKKAQPQLSVNRPGVRKRVLPQVKKDVGLSVGREAQRARAPKSPQHETIARYSKLHSKTVLQKSSPSQSTVLKTKVSPKGKAASKREVLGTQVPVGRNLPLLNPSRGLPKPTVSTKAGNAKLPSRQLSSSTTSTKPVASVRTTTTLKHKPSSTQRATLARPSKQTLTTRHKETARSTGNFRSLPPTKKLVSASVPKTAVVQAESSDGTESLVSEPDGVVKPKCPAPPPLDSFPDHPIPSGSLHRLISTLAPKIRKWRFLGRYLEISDDVLEQISKSAQLNGYCDEMLRRVLNTNITYLKLANALTGIMREDLLIDVKTVVDAGDVDYAFKLDFELPFNEARLETFEDRIEQYRNNNNQVKGIPLVECTASSNQEGTQSEVVARFMLVSDTETQVLRAVCISAYYNNFDTVSVTVCFVDPASSSRSTV